MLVPHDDSVPLIDDGYRCRRTCDLICVKDEKTMVLEFVFELPSELTLGPLYLGISFYR